MPSNDKNRLPTVHDVAAIAKVSPATVSRVFDAKWNGKIKDETREKVMRAAKTLSYTPNAIARSLYMSQTNIVALVVGVQMGYFFQEVFFDLVKKIQNAGKQILVFIEDPTAPIEEIVSQVHQYRVDAILIMANATSSYIESYFVEFGTPVVLFDRLSTSTDISYVCSDNITGARLAADYLLENGHRNIAFVTGDASGSQAVERSMSFISRVNELGGTIVYQEDGDFRYESGYAAMKQRMAGLAIDAVFCADDTMAMGVMDAAHELGLSVPGDLSVMGFDDHSVGHLPCYNLTSVGHQREKLYAGVVDTLNKVLEAPGQARRVLFPMTVVERGSVKRKENNPAG